jgi:hypothetical protein
MLGGAPYGGPSYSGRALQQLPGMLGGAPYGGPSYTGLQELLTMVPY